MSLTLITGPANAEKAGRVLGAFRADVRRGAEPVLVVPTAADVDHYRRELAGDGLVFGVEVWRFAWLLNEVARRVGVAGRTAGALEAQRIAAAALASVPRTALAADDSGPGIARAFAALAGELAEQQVDAARFIAATRQWGGADPSRAAFAVELGATYAAYRDRLAALRREDGASRGARAIDALREQPARWGTTPVHVYGFDDLTEPQLETIEALARTPAAVTLSLTHEAGREVFAARAGAYERLVAIADAHERLDSPTPAPGDRGAVALHHIERRLLRAELEPGRLFSDDGAPRTVDPGDAVVLLEGGGPQAEAELIAATVAELLADGHPPEELAIVVRRTADGSPIAEALELAGVACSREHRERVEHSALGRGVLALLRCAALDGSASDLVAYLRTPGVVAQHDRVDRLERNARVRGLTLAQAVADWETDNWPLDALGRVVAAHERGSGVLCRRLAAEVSLLLAAPFRRASHVLDADELLDARAAAELRRALGSLAGLSDADPALAIDPRDLERTLAELELFSGPPPAPGLVTVTTPGRLRARRVRTLVVAGLVEGTFPQRDRPAALLGDAERAALNAASGLRLRHHVDVLGGERFLFYAAVSRPTERLVLSWHIADEDGHPVVPSFFVEDVRDLLAPPPPVVRRRLGAVEWDDAAPSPRAAALAAAARRGDRSPAATGIAELRDPRVLAALRERQTWSASAIETWVKCPVRWFVDRLLGPDELDADAEALVGGRLAHDVLARVIAQLSVGGAPVVLRPELLPRARELLGAAIDELAPQHPISPNPRRRAAALHRLRADLLAYLGAAVATPSSFGARPDLLELSFGGRDGLPAAQLAGGELPLAGRIDRVDVDGGGRAIVYDYKGSTAAPRAKWVTEGRLQMGLYMLATRELLGLDVVGGLYQPLTARDPDDRRARGALLADADTDRKLVETDRLEPHELDELLGDVLRSALDVVGEIRSGRLEARPRTCGYGTERCAFPSICRCGDT